MDWLGDHLWAGWLALAIALGAAELASLDLILLMLAVGAIAGAISAGIGLAVVLQILIAAGASIAMLALGPAQPRQAPAHAAPTSSSGTARWSGTRRSSPRTSPACLPGRVKLDGEIWSARPYDDSLTIKAGETVEVLAMKGATVFVHPVHTALEP